MITFGLVAEGPSDQVIIENVIAGYFDNPDILVNDLQPIRDETDKSRFKSPGGWYQVFEYCRSKKFIEAFQFNDYIIIQIDTDTSEEKNYDISKIENGKKLSPQDLISRVISKFSLIIGEEFYKSYKNNIIFAISVHSIECWLLPLYFENDKAKRAKIENCLKTLNQNLSSQEGFTIAPNSKNLQYYQKISKPFLKNKILMRMKEYNPSFKIFIDEINNKNIIIEKEESDW